MLHGHGRPTPRSEVLQRWRVVEDGVDAWVRNTAAAALFSSSHARNELVRGCRHRGHGQASWSSSEAARFSRRGYGCGRSPLAWGDQEMRWAPWPRRCSLAFFTCEWGFFWKLKRHYWKGVGGVSERDSRLSVRKGSYCFFWRYNFFNEFSGPTTSKYFFKTSNQ